MELYDLRVKNIQCALGIDEAPYFSWKMRSEAKNVLQTAYQIDVASESGEVFWNSGRIEKDTSCYVGYEGKPLISRMVYLWTITVWDNHGNKARNSSTFETAFMKKSDWRAKWVETPFIAEKRVKAYGEQPPATMFRQEFTLDGDSIKRARLYATGHGIYRTYINGRRPDDREFAPENTSYPMMTCYQTYDVTSFLRPGENVLELYMGDGWYCCPNYRREDAREEPQQAALFQLEIIFEDGRMVVVSSDENVMAATGPVRFSDIFLGEKYDANFNFGDWKRGLIRDYGFDNLCAQAEAPVRPVALLPAKEIIHSPKGELIVDFGQNIAGRIRFHVKAPAGRKIVLDHFETLDKEGNCFDNLELSKKTSDGMSQRDTFISNGEVMIYEPYFTFHGFRYVRVRGYDELQMDDMTAVALSTDQRETGTFACSDERLNRLYENTRWSQRANMMSIPTDCPQREKAGWTGDIAVYAETALLNEDTTALLERWLKNLALEQDGYGAVPFVVPYAGHYPKLAKTFGRLFGNRGKALVSSAGWGDAAVIVPYRMYQVTGNTSVLCRQYDSMKAWCDYVIRQAETRRGNKKIPKDVDRYLWNTGFHWGEWLIPSLSKNGFDLNTFKGIKQTLKYVAPAYACQSMEIMAETAGITGHEADARYYSDMARRMKDAFGKGVITKDGTMPVDLMGAYVIPIAFDLVPEEFKENFAAQLVRLIHDNGGCLDTGFLATPFLLDALLLIGREDLAYELLFQEKCPSWLFEVKHGATTIWESWYGYTEDDRPLAVSMNHYAFGCVAAWMFKNICGIRRAAPGYKRFVIEPRLEASITWAQRTFDSSYGDIVVRWKKRDGRFELHVEIPCNTEAQVIMPDGAEYSLGSGSYDFG